MTCRFACCLLAVAALAAAEPRFHPTDWPCFGGPFGYGHVETGGAELITQLSQAKLVWISEERSLGTGWGHWHGPSNKGRNAIRGSGYSAPVVARGRVYIQWFEPSGDKPGLPAEKIAALRGDSRPESYLVDAEDVLLCADVATGKTIWKTRLPKGLNWNWERVGAYSQPVVLKDHIYVQGTGGYVHAVDPEDGAIIWTRGVGPGTAVWDAWRAKRYEQQDLNKSSSFYYPFNCSPVHLPPGPGVAKALVIFNDTSGPAKNARKLAMRSNLAALDATTGELAWVVEEVAGRLATPTLWRHDAGALVVTVSGDGVIKSLSTAKPDGWLAGIDAATGTERWRLQGFFSGDHTPMVVGDVLLVARSRLRTRGWERHWTRMMKSGNMPRYELPPPQKDLAPRAYGLPGLKEADLVADLGRRLAGKNGGTPSAGGGHPMRHPTKEECYQILPGWTAYRLQADGPPQELWTLPLADGPCWSTPASDGTLLYLQGFGKSLIVDLVTGTVQAEGPKLDIHLAIAHSGGRIFQCGRGFDVSSGTAITKMGGVRDAAYRGHPYMSSCLANGRLFVRGFQSGEPAAGEAPERGAIFCFDLRK